MRPTQSGRCIPRQAPWRRCRTASRKPALRLSNPRPSPGPCRTTPKRSQGCCSLWRWIRQPAKSVGAGAVDASFSWLWLFPAATIIRRSSAQPASIDALAVVAASLGGKKRNFVRQNGRVRFRACSELQQRTRSDARRARSVGSAWTSCGNRLILGPRAPDAEALRDIVRRLCRRAIRTDDDSGHLGGVDRRVRAPSRRADGGRRGHVEQCGKIAVHPHRFDSCRNRSRPNCQDCAGPMARGSLPNASAPYVHVVFTLIAPVGEIAFRSKSVV